MINQFQCLACKGVYFDASADGATYHHACPGLKIDPFFNVPEREDARDENLARASNYSTPSIRSEGAGVKCLSNPKLLEPPWITALKRRITKEETK